MFSPAWTLSISAELVKAAGTAALLLQPPEALQQSGNTFSGYSRRNSQTKNSCEIPGHLGELITGRVKSHRKVYL